MVQICFIDNARCILVHGFALLSVKLHAGKHNDWNVFQVMNSGTKIDGSFLGVVWYKLGVS